MSDETETITKPIACTFRSPNLSMSFPAGNPKANRAKAKAEMMAPMAALFTWNVFAKSGIAGMIIP